MSRHAIGIDLGGTRIKGVLIDRDGNILSESITDTIQQDSAHWKRAIGDMIFDFRESSGLRQTAVGLSAPGLANEANTCIAIMPGRLAGLENLDWSGLLGERVWVLNDAHAAMMAEAKFGAASGLKHAALITLGTGVGGAVLINGQLYQGVAQMAGHIGHTTVDAMANKQDITRMPGSIEDAIGNESLKDRSKGKYDSTEALIADMKRGDAHAKEIWETSVRKLAVCMASVINVLSPEVFLLSGGLVQADHLLMEPLQHFLDLYEWRPGGKKTPIRRARFSEQAGAVGAAAFALSKTK